MRRRGFEKISLKQFKKDFQDYITNPEEAYQAITLPVRKTVGSAGYDFHTLFSFTLNSGESILLPTGIKAYMEKDEFLAILIRSSLGIKKKIKLMNQVGIIDHDYYQNISNEGHIMVGLINMGDAPWVCQKGEAIVQGIFMNYLVTDNEKTNGFIRLGGIGSTDKEKLK
ncbi:MAG: dUTP diphosphatase [Bacilli bacterium]|jgi:dUTP pyrophosphatase|nr:dUTP diphosphatase [Bacilli bacterium]HHU23661.1 dUTP diphosphatase [Acholeplasmataceae bacterium]